MHRRVGCSCQRPPRAEPGDPRFRRLAWGDGRVRYRLLDASSEESARLAEGLLRETSWGLHRVGRARGAHGPNRLRLVYAWQIPGTVPAAWSNRLEPGAAVDARSRRRIGRRTAT